MRFLRNTWILIFGMVISCIDPLDIDFSEAEEILVVEGYISSLPGPHNIRLSTSAEYLEGQIKPVIGADVWVRDEDGNNTFLTESVSGVYLTPPGFRAQVGKSYVLNINTNTGFRYASLPEFVQAVPEIDSLSVEFVKRPSVDPLEFVSGMEVYGIFNDPPEERNYYIWRNSGVYVVETFPERYVAPGPPPRVNAPKDCCRTCWIVERNGDFSIYIHNDNNTNGQRTTQQVAFIEDEGKRFTRRYRLTVEQLSLSKEAYEFFRIIDNQKGIDGDIFDPPPATVRGNIINLNNPSENVIGYFHASDGAVITRYIDRDELDETQTLVEINDDCRELGASSDVPPPDWISN